MTAPPLSRRLALALVAIAAAGTLLRPQVASSLVERGDESLYRSQPLTAMSFYRRALWLDPGCALAVDRFLFVAMTLRDRSALEAGIGFASRFLANDPNDEAVRMDRAMAYRVTGHFEPAMRDFAIVGARKGDARAFAFAGLLAERIGRRRLARTFWRSAVVLVPGARVARRALARLGDLP